MEKETASAGLVVVDTSIFIDYLRNYPPAIEYIQTIDREKEITLLFSAITETELISGKSCETPIIRTGVLDMLNSFTKIEVTNQIALKAGDVCRIYKLATPDAVIAATALINNAELITKNTKDFKGIPGLIVKNPY